MSFTLAGTNLSVVETIPWVFSRQEDWLELHCKACRSRLLRLDIYRARVYRPHREISDAIGGHIKTSPQCCVFRMAESPVTEEQLAQLKHLRYLLGV